MRLRTAVLLGVGAVVAVRAIRRTRPAVALVDVPCDGTDRHEVLNSDDDGNEEPPRVVNWSHGYVPSEHVVRSGAPLG